MPALSACLRIHGEQALVVMPMMSGSTSCMHQPTLGAFCAKKKKKVCLHVILPTNLLAQGKLTNSQLFSQSVSLSVWSYICALYRA